jgi:hypothetical protein
MSRSGYNYEWDDNWELICYRGAVNSAIRGARGQAFLREMLAALDAMPEKKLIAEELVERDGAVCALGAVGKQRAMDMNTLDPEDIELVAHRFGIATALAREITWANDEMYDRITPEARYGYVREWVVKQIKPSTS